MNIYKYKAGEGKVAELAKEFNKTDFERRVSLLMLLPNYALFVVIIMILILGVIYNASIFLITLLSMAVFALFFVVSITGLLYCNFVKDYVISLKDENGCE